MSLLAESTPKQMRGRAAALLQAGEPVGVGLAAIMGLLVAPFLGWRWVFLVSSFSGVLALAVRRFLPESRLWIECKSTHHSAAAVVRDCAANSVWEFRCSWDSFLACSS